MQTLDGIKPEPKTELEAHKRWLNRVESELRSMPGYGRKIDVIDDFWAKIHGDSKADAEHARQEDEAIQDA